MMTALSGTPGTGKSSVADELEKRNILVTRVIDTIEKYRMGADPDRDTDLIDDEKWIAEFSPVEGIIEGHLSHLLPADKIIILRCRPDILKERLSGRGYPPEKIAENVEAELLDVILIEAVEEHESSKIFEIDTTSMPITAVADQIIGVLNGTVSPSVGTVDWLSECGEMV